MAIIICVILTPVNDETGSVKGRYAPGILPEKLEWS
jgi:hypothetical protein